MLSMEAKPNRDYYVYSLTTSRLAFQTEEEIDLLIYLRVEYPELLARYLHHFNGALGTISRNSVQQ